MRRIAASRASSGILLDVLRAGSGAGKLRAARLARGLMTAIDLETEHRAILQVPEYPEIFARWQQHRRPNAGRPGRSLSLPEERYERLAAFAGEHHVPAAQRIAAIIAVAAACAGNVQAPARPPVAAPRGRLAHAERPLRRS